MKDYTSFIFESYAFDPQTGEIRLRYTLDDEIAFTEILQIPTPHPLPPTPYLDSALFTLHLAGGVSYFKTCCPKNIEVRSGSLSKDQAAFWNSVYENGLGEFFYQNQIDFRGLINFPVALSTPAFAKATAGRQQAALSTPHGHTGKTLVPVGGGKDSIVTIEQLRKDETANLTLLRMGSHPLIDELVSVTGLPCITVSRKLPRKLFEMNEQGALNGHVPITAFLSALCVVVSKLQGFDTIAMSNEKSASIGNIEYLGKDINHQWSKSEEFETMFASYIKNHIDPDIQYFSALRDRTELEIVGEFAKLPQYFHCVTSCNRNWKISGSATRSPEGGEVWCGTCPKCTFVFALMAAHVKKDTVVKIFEKNIFDDAAAIPLYKQLLGVEGFKPFECVGTPEETKQAFAMIADRGDFDDTPVMQMYRTLQ